MSEKTEKRSLADYAVFADGAVRVELQNGVRCIVLPHSYSRSVAMDICLLGGARDERDSEAGISHTLEHLLFKATKKTAGNKLAERIDELGGDLNAHTDVDSLHLHALVEATSWHETLELLSELVLEPEFSEQDLELEKGVIRQEILEAEDDPGGAVYDCLCGILWPESAFGRPVYGSLESLSRVCVDDLKQRLSELLHGSRVIVAVSGNVVPDEVIEFVSRAFGDLPKGSLDLPPVGKMGAGFLKVPRSVGQVYLDLAIPWPSMVHPLYFPGLLISTALGEGMSSRLFWTLREEKGLCYEVSSTAEAHKDTGALVISCILENSGSAEALKLIRYELEDVAKNGLLQKELMRAKKMLLSQLAIDEDSLMQKLWRALIWEKVLSRLVSADELIAAIEKVTLSDVAECAALFIDLRKEACVLGGDVD